MRPIKLTMTAFGPYKATETIDFQELDHLQLFVISGATGAGKTTIFDAICFALYGCASGTDRENIAMLRSHFASDDVHTKVELIFDIKERTYRVLRQIGHVKSGNKSKTGERYELYERTETEEVPCVDRQIVTEINEKIEQLIGLTEDQFKQIVMLPQGEFRKLLTSETENKEEILRRLFNTGKYNRMNGLLKEKRDHLIGEYQQQQLQLEQTIHSIHGSLRPFEGSETFATLNQEYYEPTQVLRGLEADLDVFEQAIKRKEQEYNEAIQAYEKEQSLYHEGLALNKQLEELQSKRTDLTKMNEEKERMKQKEQVLKQAEDARQLIPYETQLNDIKKELQKKQAAAQEQQQTLQETERSFQKAQVNYEQEKHREYQRDQLKLELDKYKNILPTVEKSAQEKSKLKQMEMKLHQLAKQLETNQAEKKQSHEAILEWKEKMKDEEKRAEKVYELYFRLEQTKKHYTLLNQYHALWKETAELKKRTATEKEKYEKILAAYKQLEHRWLNAQAVMLADSLVEDSACPVCGSTHHPSPAIAEKDEVSKETLEKRGNEVEFARNTYEQVANKLDGLLYNLEDKAAELKAEEIEVDTDNIESTINQLIKRGHDDRKEYNEAKAFHETLATTKKKLEDMEKREEALIEKTKEIEKAYQDERTAYTSLNASYIEKMRHIPDDLQDINVLKKTIQQKQKELEEQLHIWEQTKKVYEETKEDQQRLRTGIEHIQKQLQELDEKKTKAEEVFTEQLTKAGFSNASLYEQSKRSEQECQQLKNTIEHYRKQYHLLTEQITELERKLQGKSKVDIREIEVTLNHLKKQYEAAFEKWNQSKQERKAALHLIVQIETLAQDAARKEKEAGVMKDLHDVLRGQNELKISFERYLQIDYLDNIIETANERFQELMNGQFYLMRSDRQEAYGKQSGLAIDVFDSYTGQTRDVKTLSGGEKFIASLCLALGMSDVIQSFQGNISIQTMFIDEGFGSLDEESLHRSLQALIQLQEGGRLIGVISHVEELKTIFPAILEVTKTKDGHSSTDFVIK